MEKAHHRRWMWDWQLDILDPRRGANVSAIEAMDYEEQFVEALRQRNNDPRITASQGDGLCVTIRWKNEFDRALSMLVLHFVSDARQAVAEMFSRGAARWCRCCHGLGHFWRNAQPAHFSGIPSPQSSLARSLGVALLS